MSDLLARLDELVTEHHPELAGMLAPGADPAQVTAAWEQATGQPMPDGYAELLAWHDGCTGVHYAEFAPGMGMLASLAEALEDWQVLREAFDWSGEYEQRFPLTGEGREVAVRFADGLLVGPWPGGPVPVFDSIPAMLVTLAAAYEAGVLAGDDEGFLGVTDIEVFTAVHARHNQRSSWPYR